MVVATTPAGRPTGMALFGYEDDTWMFTAFGMAGREPPTEPADRLAFVEAITPPHVMDGTAECGANQRDLPLPVPRESVAALRQDETVSDGLGGHR